MLSGETGRKPFGYRIIFRVSAPLIGAEPEGSEEGESRSDPPFELLEGRSKTRPTCGLRLSFRKGAIGGVERSAFPFAERGVTVSSSRCSPSLSHSCSKPSSKPSRFSRSFS